MIGLISSMIQFAEHRLSNGLQVIVHEDHQSPMVCLNLLYKVGSRNENPTKTGFAHLFEHLMFGGSKNVANFDGPLQNVGGENNAFTSPDITNYYITIPANNVETAFWLESDRMAGLSFNPEVLEVQRKVVIEEFKQRYLNQPYGDVWLKLRPLAYQVHPYQWATIGKEIGHIEQATLEDVKDFFKRFYHPANAILVIAGAISETKALALAEKWFGSIPAFDQATLTVQEPTQKSARMLELKADVPAAAIYKAYHMVGRHDAGYYATDLLCDILGRGGSSILYQRLVKQNPIFSSLSAYHTGSVDPGLLTISGKVNEGISLEEANQKIESTIEELLSTGLTDREVEKVKNQSEASLVFSETELLNRAMSLAYSAFLGDTDLVNTELDRIRSVQKEDIMQMAKQTLKPENCSTLFYYTEN